MAYYFPSHFCVVTLKTVHEYLPKELPSEVHIGPDLTAQEKGITAMYI